MRHPVATVRVIPRQVAVPSLGNRPSARAASGCFRTLCDGSRPHYPATTVPVILHRASASFCGGRLRHPATTVRAILLRTSVSSRSNRTRHSATATRRPELLPPAFARCVTSQIFLAAFGRFVTPRQRKTTHSIHFVTHIARFHPKRRTKRVIPAKNTRPLFARRNMIGPYRWSPADRPGWPLAPARKRPPGGCCHRGGSRNGRRLIEICRAHAPQPGNADVDPR